MVVMVVTCCVQDVAALRGHPSLTVLMLNVNKLGRCCNHDACHACSKRQRAPLPNATCAHSNPPPPHRAGKDSKGRNNASVGTGSHALALLRCTGTAVLKPQSSIHRFFPPRAPLLLPKPS